MPHSSHMIEERLEMAGQIFSAGVRNQSYTSWLNEIWQAASPVVSQLYKSNYVWPRLSSTLSLRTDDEPDLHVSAFILFSHEI